MHRTKTVSFLVAFKALLFTSATFCSAFWITHGNSHTKKHWKDTVRPIDAVPCSMQGGNKDKSIVFAGEGQSVIRGKLKLGAVVRRVCAVEPKQ